MAPSALAAVAAALQRLSSFFVTNHAAHSKCNDNQQASACNQCSHNAPFPYQSQMYHYLATAFCLSVRCRTAFSLYGLTSSQKNPSTSRNAAAVPMPNTPVVAKVPI